MLSPLSPRLNEITNEGEKRRAAVKRIARFWRRSFTTKAIVAAFRSIDVTRDQALRWRQV